jgi:NitT/TauT family transport system permease protein
LDLAATRGFIARSVVPIATFLVVWELVTLVGGIPAYILPSPVQILQKTGEASQLLLSHSLFSLAAIVFGFAAAAAGGFLLAVAIAYSRWVERVTEPFIVVSQVIPKVALAPLFLIWFGHGLTPKIIIVASIAFFPVLVNTVLGLKSVEREVVELMESIAATKRQVFWKVRVPNALPYIFPSLKVAALLSVVGAMVGEFVGTDRGLGYLMILGNTNLETDLLFASLLVVTVIGLAIYGAIGLAEKLVLNRFGDGAAMQLASL